MPDALERVASDPAADAVYQQLLKMLEGIGSFTIEPGKASFLIRNGSAFLGVHPRRGALRVNVVLDRPLTAERVVKVEQVSRGRFHNEVLLTRPGQVDAELGRWVAEARKLTAAT